ncbi:hypothetical protein JCM19235_2744 [Vibrio maritimus]|uniref:Uncharacterized protein n=1 Tax=Vibrio maritimus TaxID=990268 RepID=A0A090S2W9_9VIBR|nr:hypothetical protein JCM19235_2744 [Vibrio maritimus]
MATSATLLIHNRQILSHTFSNRLKLNITTRSTQVRQICLRVLLVSTFK